MKICQTHWDICREAVKARGLGSLIAADGHEAIDRTVAELQGAPAKQTFDPLMSMHWHFMNEAMRCGGLYLMAKSESPENDGHYCPICEFENHAKGFDAKEQINRIADDMAKWARSEALIPQVS